MLIAWKVSCEKICGISRMSIELTMNIHLFEWITMAPYVTFIDPEHLTLVREKIRAAASRRFGSPAALFYDSDCAVCSRGAVVVRLCDFFGRLKTVSFHDSAQTGNYPDFGTEQAQAARRELLLRLPSGRWIGGFGAFRRIAWSLPALWLITPLLYIPGVSAAAKTLYGYVSKNRIRLFSPSPAQETCQPGFAN